MGMGAAKREPPRLAAKYWPEFQGKQTLMLNYLTKHVAETLSPPTVPPNGPSILATAFSVLEMQLPPLPVKEPPASNAG